MLCYHICISFIAKPFLEKPTSLCSDSLLYCAPEALVLPKWRDALEDSSVSHHVVVVVIDEVHCVYKWYFLYAEKFLYKVIQNVYKGIANFSSILLSSSFGIINWASEASPTLGCSIEISRDWRASEASETLSCLFN